MNFSANPTEIPTKVVIQKVTLANQVPPVALLTGTLGESVCSLQKDWILDELNLHGLEDWPEDEQKQARKLLTSGNTCLLTVTWTWERGP